MNTLTKLALGVLGQLHGQPASGAVLGEMALPPAQTTGGLPVMQALQQRQSQRDFRPDALEPPTCRTCCGPPPASTVPSTAAAPRPRP